MDSSIPTNKRVLILTAHMGYGHRSAAKAVAAALEERFGDQVEATIVNPLDLPRAPLLLRSGQYDYDRIVRELPDLYRYGYVVAGSPISAPIMETAFTVLLFEVLFGVLREHQPDVIVCTFDPYLAPLDAVFTVTRRMIPVLTIVTDLASVHRTWFHDVSDLCLVPTPAVQKLAQDANFDPEKIRLTGLPTHPRFAHQTRARADLRAAFGWDADRITAFAVGSKRVSNLLETLRVLNHSGFPLQLVVAAGGDDETYAELQQTEWHVPAHVYNFVDDMPAMMRAADFVVCKAGGLMVTESLACGLPILLIDLIHGQETGNAAYVVDGGAGELAENPLEVLEIVCHWLANGAALLRDRAARARDLGRPNAAYDAAQSVWELAQRGVTRKRPLTDLSRVTDLLNNFNIPWLREDDRADTPGGAR